MIVKTKFGDLITATEVYQYSDRLMVHTLTDDGLQILTFYLREVLSVECLEDNVTFGGYHA